MKLIPTSPCSVLIAFAALLFTPGLFAQGKSGKPLEQHGLPNPVRGATPPVEISSVVDEQMKSADARLAHDVAKGLAKARDLPAAEKRLAELNSAAPNTEEWHLQTCERLVRLAGDLTLESAENAGLVAARALQRLSEADQVARGKGNRKVQVGAKMLAAFVHERYRGDTAAAIVSYQEALAIDPSDHGAREALERLQRADAMLKARFNLGTKK